MPDPETGLRMRKRPLSLVLCSYSYGLGNGIAHMDKAMERLDPERFQLRRIVLRPDFAPGVSEEQDGVLYLALAGAYPILCGLLREADLLHVNGPYDPVAVNAACAVGVPGVIEVMHQVETGGLHPGIDEVLCVSELVQSVQSHAHTRTIYNGIDVQRFSFSAERRHPDCERVIQAANAAKILHWELGEVAALLDEEDVDYCMVGNRAAVYGLPSLGLVADMPGVYHTADILFVLEKRYAFGLVFAEAMACGTLPIVSGDSGAAAYVEHGASGWVVEPGTLEDAAAVLRQAIATARGPKARAMRERARQTVQTRLSLGGMLRQYEAVYERLGARARKSPKAPERWMDLGTALLLFRAGNTAAFAFLDRFAAKSEPLDPTFLTHPMGQSTLGVLLRDICPALAARGYAALIRRVCAVLRHSHVTGPLLDRAEQDAGL